MKKHFTGVAVAMLVLGLSSSSWALFQAGGWEPVIQTRTPLPVGAPSTSSLIYYSVGDGYQYKRETVASSGYLIETISRQMQNPQTGLFFSPTTFSGPSSTLAACDMARVQILATQQDQNSCQSAGGTWKSADEECSCR